MKLVGLVLLLLQDIQKIKFPIKLGILLSIILVCISFSALYFHETHRIEALAKYCVYFLLIFVIHIYLQSEYQINLNIISVVWTIFTIFNLILIMQLVYPTSQYIYSGANLIDLNRPTSFFINHTDMGLFGIIFLAMLCPTKTSHVMLLYAFAFLMAILGGSKSGIILISISLLLFGAQRLRNLIVLSVLLFMIFMFASELYQVVCEIEKSVCRGFEAFASIAQNGSLQSRSFSNRVDDWIGVIEAIVSSPIVFLLGIGEYSAAHLNGRGSIEVGILAHIMNLGFALTILFYGWIFWLIKKHAYSPFVLNAYCIMLIGDFLVNTYQNQIIMVLFMFSLILQSARRERTAVNVA